MRTITADILSDSILTTADAVCFTSNGIVKKDGKLVMGAGNALAFKQKFPGIDEFFGNDVKIYGNFPNVWPTPGNRPVIVNFPTKNHWRDPSDIKLIKRSAITLMEIVNTLSWRDVYLCAPGIGLGGLKWPDVSKILESIFDDRVIITFKPKV